MDSPTFYWVGAALSACALWRLGVQTWPPPEFVEGSGAPLCLPQAGTEGLPYIFLGLTTLFSNQTKVFGSRVRGKNP